MLENKWVQSGSSWSALALNIVPVLIFFSVVSGEGGSMPVVFTLLSLTIIISIFAIYVNRGKNILNTRVAVLGLSFSIGITMFMLAVASVTDLSQIT
ncbi:hypothetical protein [Halobacillus salinus]|uniref:hypothetical protein n=1 Tax=Halobacillus salinus TaxID=192814 RepID=UPI0009A5816D|nr:hypothetical protein [Halobacillus salinus]